MTGILGEATIRELETNVAGSVIAPGDPNYETARWAWNHAIDRHPALIVRPASSEDVLRAVGFARSEGRPIAVRSGATALPAFPPVTTGLSSILDSSTMFSLILSRGGRTPAAARGGGIGRSDTEVQVSHHRRPGVHHRYRRLHFGRRPRPPRPQVRARMRQLASP